MKALIDRVRPYLKEAIVVPAFFVILFGVGYAAHDDYGISWDEPNMYGVGEYAYNYVFGDEPWPEEQSKRYYGTGFELIMATFTHGMEDPRQIFYMRHLLTFIGFFFGVIGFYFLCKKLFDDWRMGLLGAVMLTMSPRIFADGFYNSKDAISLSVFILGFFTLIRFLERKTLKNALIHAAGTAIAISVRITGVIIPVLSIGLLMMQSIVLFWKKEQRLTNWWVQILTYAITAPIFTIMIWPFLWEQPIAHFKEAYDFMSGIGIDTFYLGEQIHALPWHYVFVWIGITTPILYSILFVIGLIYMLITLLRHPIDAINTKMNQALMLAWFFLPILSVYVSGAGIFDGWRHMYFIYPAFLVIGLYGLQWMIRTIPRISHGHLKKGFYGFGILLIGCSLITTLIDLYRYHPIQNAYFSIPAHYVDGNFELDYWGLSFRPAFEWIVANDDRPMISIHPTISPGYSTVNVLPDSVLNRIRITDKMDDADYIVDVFRFHYDTPQDYYDKEVHAFYVNGVKVTGIYKMK